MSKQLIANRETRMAKVKAQALSFGLKVEEVGGHGVIRFTKESGQRETVYGVWAAEILLQGYRFAMTNIVPKEQPGRWKDDEEDDDSSWDF